MFIYANSSANVLPMTLEMTDDGTITFLDLEEGQLRVTSFHPSSFLPDLPSGMVPELSDVEDAVLLFGDGG